MAEYDNTNDGVAFPPFEDMKMILQGKMNIEGREGRYAIVRRQTQGGMEIMEVFEKVGVMFKQEGGKDGSPDYTGKIYDMHDKRQPWTDPHPNRRIAAWRRMKDEKPYMSFNISEQQNTGKSESLPKDEIPF